MANEDRSIMRNSIQIKKISPGSIQGI
jgi:hypothetical protein